METIKASALAHPRFKADPYPFYETTVNLIGSAALALLQHPDQRARFVSEPGLTKSAIEELLRYTSPVEMTPPRIPREDVTLSSVTIPRGEWVVAVLGSANHDGSVFRDPETLDLARDPNPHVKERGPCAYEEPPAPWGND